MSIRLITFSGQTVTPKTDGIIQDASIGQNGIFYGCGVTASGNSLHIDGGYGLIKGRYFEIDATTVPVTLATSDTLLGRLYVKLDLSNTEAPIQILTATGETLPSLEQDADANFDDGVWEMELATFNITTTDVSDVVETYQAITDNATLVDALQTAINSLQTATNDLSTNKISGVTSGRNVAVTATAETLFTVPYTGWLVASGTTLSGQTLAPYMDISAENGVALASGWGNTATNASIRIACPVKKGQKYSVHIARCKLDSVRLHY